MPCAGQSPSLSEPVESAHDRRVPKQGRTDEDRQQHCRDGPNNTEREPRGYDDPRKRYRKDGERHLTAHQQKDAPDSTTKNRKRKGDCCPWRSSRDDHLVDFRHSSDVFRVCLRDEVQAPHQIPDETRRSDDPETEMRFVLCHAPASHAFNVNAICKFRPLQQANCTKVILPKRKIVDL